MGNCIILHANTQARGATLQHSEEPRVKWPDPWEPVYVTRPLTLARGGHRPLQINALKLIVLCNHCLYLVAEDKHGLRTGQVLARNLDLTRRRGGKQGELETEQFIRFENLNAARRGVSKYDPGQGVEQADINRWLADLDWMVRTSWTLHRADPDEQAQYIARAENTAAARSRVRNEEKVEAAGRTSQASSPIDSIGRPNTGRLPLICFAGERKLHDRIQQMRGIGRRMSWRELVLMHYIDRLREISKQVRRDAEQRWKSSPIAGPKRRPSRLLQEATRMRWEAGQLRKLIGRPFDRNFLNVARDLEEAADQMQAAAAARDSSLIEQVKATLRKIFRSSQLLVFHWDLEELLVSISTHQVSKQGLTPQQRRLWYNEVERIHRMLKGRESTTNEPWEKGYRRKVLPRVNSELQLAKVNLAQKNLNLKQAYEHLKGACAPL